MSAAWGEPRVPLPKPASVGPRLVRTREPVPARAVGTVERLDPHPLAAAFVIAGIALIGAFTFVGSILMWVWFRDTGVNWLFQGP